VLDHAAAQAPAAPDTVLPVVDVEGDAAAVAVVVAVVVDVEVDADGAALVVPWTGVHKAVVVGFQPVAAQLTWLTSARYRRPS
jgi:hypothetical protein